MSKIKVKRLHPYDLKKKMGRVRPTLSEHERKWVGQHLPACAGQFPDKGCMAVKTLITANPDITKEQIIQTIENDKEVYCDCPSCPFWRNN